MESLNGFGLIFYIIMGVESTFNVVSIFFLTLLEKNNVSHVM
jgi:hypothetical protein